MGETGALGVYGVEEVGGAVGETEVLVVGWGVVDWEIGGAGLGVCVCESTK